MIIKRFAMTGNRMKKKISLVRKKFLQKPKAIVHYFLSEPQQTNDGEEENEQQDLFDVRKVFKPGKQKINKE
jgi:hypothetical protein